MIGLTDKVKDDLNLLAHRNLLGNLDHCVLQTEVGRVDETIRIGDVTEHPVRLVAMLEHKGIDTMVRGRISSENDVGRHVALHTTSTLNERIATDTYALLQHHATTLDGIVVKFAVAGDTYTDTYDTMAVNLDVMADVYAVHQVVVITDDRSMVGKSTSRNDHIFTDMVVISDNDACRVSLDIVEILRMRANDGILMNDITIAHRRTFQDTGMSLYRTIVTNDDTFLNICKRFDSNALSQSGFGMNVG